MASEPEPTTEQLIAAYADDPASLAPAERAAVEAQVARDPAAATMLDESRRALAALREASPAAIEPDWDRLSADIGSAIDAAPRRRPWRVAAVGALAIAAAAAVALWLHGRGARHEVAQIHVPDAGQPAPREVVPLDRVPPAPADQTDDDVYDVVASEDLPDDLGGLGGMVALDEGMMEELAPDEPERFGPSDDLPSAFDSEELLPDTGWVDDLSDEDVDRALRLLDNG